MFKKSSGFFNFVEPPKPNTFEFDSFYTASSTFTVTTSGWYRVYIWGKSGNGSFNNAGGTNLGGKGGTGGGSGGFAASYVWLVSNEPNPIDINESFTSMFNSSDYRFLRANSGSDGERASPGVGGTAVGGNIVNLPGGTGGDGGLGLSGTGTSSPGIRGGNSGALGGPSINGQGPGGGGGGGARLPGDGYCPYVAIDMNTYRGGSGATNGNSGESPLELPDITLGKLYGAGSGAGGSGSNTYGSVPGGKGQGGIVIIERGLV